MPGVKANLLSVKKITEHDVEILFRGSRASIKKSGRVVAVAAEENGLYRLDKGKKRSAMTQEKNKRAAHRGVLTCAISRFLGDEFLTGCVCCLSFVGVFLERGCAQT